MMAEPSSRKFNVKRRCVGSPNFARAAAPCREPSVITRIFLTRASRFPTKVLLKESRSTMFRVSVGIVGVSPTHNCRYHWAAARLGIEHRRATTANCRICAAIIKFSETEDHFLPERKRSDPSHITTTGRIQRATCIQFRRARYSKSPHPLRRRRIGCAVAKTRMPGFAERTCESEAANESGVGASGDPVLAEKDVIHPTAGKMDWLRASTPATIILWRSQVHRGGEVRSGVSRDA